MTAVSILMKVPGLFVYDDILIIGIYLYKPVKDMHILALHMLCLFAHFVRFKTISVLRLIHSVYGQNYIIVMMHAHRDLCKPSQKKI